MRTFFLVLLFFSVGILSAQTITGVVKEKKSGLPLPSANIFINNTSQGVASDEEGRFTLSGDFPTKIELVASFVGYVTEVKSISFSNKNKVQVTFELEFNESSLTEIELKSKRDKNWEREFRRFKDVFLALPDDPYKSKIEILNPWVVDFEKVKPNKGPNYLKASAQEPLLIINRALGYQINYYLQEFRVLRNGTRFFGQVFYEDLETENSEEDLEWETSRASSYYNSIRHLNQSILLNTPDSVHYRLYQTLPETLIRVRTNDLDEEIDQSILPVQKDSILRRPLGDGNYRIFLPGRMEVHHFDKPWKNDYYINVFYALSWMEAPDGFYDIDRNGVLINPTQLIVSGYLGRQRVARTLPLDFVPESGYMTQDAESEIIDIPALLQNRLREKVWLSTNKPYYYPGETAWLGGRMLYQESALQDSLSRVVHVELIGDNSKIHQSATFPVDEGKISGGLVLPKDLKAGDYAIRAYTNWNLNFPEEDLFVAPFLVMEAGFQPVKESEENEPFWGEVEIDSKFTLSDSVNYRVMDLELSFLDEFQNPINGEFVMSITDAETVVDFETDNTLEKSLEWLDTRLPEDFETDFPHPIEYGISFRGTFIPAKRRQPLVQTITIVRGDLEDFGQVRSDSAGQFWATGLYFSDTAQIAISAVDDKRRPFGSVELKPLSKAADLVSIPKLAYSKVADPQENAILDISGDYILLEEFVREGEKTQETMAERNYGYGTPSREMGQERLEKMVTWEQVFQSMGLFSNYNYGEKTSPPMVILDGQKFPFIDPSEILEALMPSELESVKVYSDPSSKAIFGMLGYGGVIMVETKKGSRTGSESDRNFNSEGFQLFPLPGFTSFPEFPKNPPSDQYLKKSPTVFWEANGKTFDGVYQTTIKIPQGVKNLRLKLEGRTLDGEAFLKIMRLKL